MTFDWRDKSTMEAVLFYVRLVVGVLMVVILVILLFYQRVNLTDVFAAMAGLLGFDRLSHAIIGAAQDREK